MKSLDIFIKGDVVNLCIPTKEFAKESQWYSWFNNQSITKYLEQGLFVNTPEKQLDFFQEQEANRLIFIIANKTDYIGVISLSKINLVKKKCDIAIVVDNSIDRKLSPYAALEAMARVTEHAFNIMGINRIEAGQHVDLHGWQQRMELLGYKLEGVHCNKFVKGRSVDDAVSLACLYSDYQEIVKHRGSLWDSIENMKLRCKKLPNKSFKSMLSEFYNDDRNAYYEKIFNL